MDEEVREAARVFVASQVRALPRLRLDRAQMPSFRTSSL